MQIVNGVLYVEVAIPLRWFDNMEEELGIKIEELPEEVLQEFISYSAGFGTESYAEMKEILKKRNIKYTIKFSNIHGNFELETYVKYDLDVLNNGNPEPVSDIRVVGESQTYIEVMRDIDVEPSKIYKKFIVHVTKVNE